MGQRECVSMNDPGDKVGLSQRCTFLFMTHKTTKRLINNLESSQSQMFPCSLYHSCDELFIFMTHLPGADIIWHYSI